MCYCKYIWTDLKNHKLNSYRLECLFWVWIYDQAFIRTAIHLYTHPYSDKSLLLVDLLTRLRSIAWLANSVSIRILYPIRIAGSFTFRNTGGKQGPYVFLTRVVTERSLVFNAVLFLSLSFFFNLVLNRPKCQRLWKSRRSSLTFKRV